MKRHHALVLLLLIFSVACPNADAPVTDSVLKQPVQTSTCDIPQAEQDEILKHIHHSRDMWKGSYPTPIDPTCDVLRGVQKELTNDDTRLLLEVFSRDDQHKRVDALAELGKKRAFHTLLALSVHGNPDIRIDAVNHIKSVMATKSLTNFSAEGLAEFEALEDVVFKFYLHLLETTPRSISGSENSTIHGIYVSNIGNTLDLIQTGKLRTERRQVSDEDMKRWGARAD